MAIKRVNYSREFLSETSQWDTSHHGSSQWEPYQKINAQDERLRKEIDKKFSLKENTTYSFEGFDGKFEYIFGITSNLQEHGNNPEKNKKYHTTVAIKKAGEEKTLDEFSDLEKFLLDNKFFLLDNEFNLE